MLQPGQRLALDAEASQLGTSRIAASQDHLERYNAVGFDLAGAIDNAHSAAAQLAENLVTGRSDDALRWLFGGGLGGHLRHGRLRGWFILKQGRHTVAI